MTTRTSKRPLQNSFTTALMAKGLIDTRGGAYQQLQKMAGKLKSTGPGATAFSDQVIGGVSVTLFSAVTAKDSKKMKKHYITTVGGALSRLPGSKQALMTWGFSADKAARISNDMAQVRKVAERVGFDYPRVVIEPLPQ